MLLSSPQNAQRRHRDEDLSENTHPARTHTARGKQSFLIHRTHGRGQREGGKRDQKMHHFSINRMSQYLTLKEYHEINKTLLRRKFDGMERIQLGKYIAFAQGDWSSSD
jgi:hypothetical protein